MAPGKNRLADETSPYLLQHADNPVDWYPWCPDALTKAREENKPILLSIGYSACHWCHVMAHESFEDEATAKTMNELFVNIKVDREERPDLDKVYQTAHQLLTQQGGGWPLTMFLDPKTLIPFFGGTYFPKTPRYQLPGFVDLLLRVSQVFRDQRDELTAQGTKLANVFGNLNPAAAPGQSEGRRAAHRGARSTRRAIRCARRRLRHRAEIPDADHDRTVVAALGVHRTSAEEERAERPRNARDGDDHADAHRARRHLRPRRRRLLPLLDRRALDDSALRKDAVRQRRAARRLCRRARRSGPIRCSNRRCARRPNG